MINMDPNAPSCWTCRFQQTGAANLLGSCLWFVENENQAAKPIPPSVVDKGCDYYEKKPHHPRVPHYHTCRSCADRHQFECREPRCVWSILVDCPAAAPATAATKKETT